MLQVIYMMYIGLSLTKDPIIEKKLRKEAAQEYQKIFKGTKVSYMERPILSQFISSLSHNSKKSVPFIFLKLSKNND